MRNRILTDKEREMLGRFLNGENNPATFRMLKLRIKNGYVQITEDFELIKMAMEKF